jgi:hypothetical protein
MPRNEGGAGRVLPEIVTGGGRGEVQGASRGAQGLHAELRLQGLDHAQDVVCI